MKTTIVKGVVLKFVKEDDGKFTFSSNNPKMQSWIENCKKKRVKRSEIGFVTWDARIFWKSGMEVTPVVKDFKEDFVSELNCLCQKNKQTPVYEYWEYGPKNELIHIAEVTVGDNYVQGAGTTKKAARQNAAQNFLYPGTSRVDVVNLFTKCGGCGSSLSEDGVCPNCEHEGKNSCSNCGKKTNSLELQEHGGECYHCSNLPSVYKQKANDHENFC